MASNKSYKKNYDNYNPGISLLKMLMCFEVIVAHLWRVRITSSGPIGWLWYLRDYAVPVFMILAFFFSEKLFSEGKSWDGLWKRIVKLIVPLWVWAVVYWIVYKLLQELLYPGFNLQLKDLAWQMFTGNSVYLNGAMWFQVDLIILTLLFAVIVFVGQKFKNHIFVLLSTACIYLQYYALTFFIFKWKTELAGPSGRLFEMFPMAVAGYMLANYGLLNKAKKNWVTTIVVCVVAMKLLRWKNVVALLDFDTLDPGKQGFDYAGINRIVVALVLIFLFFVPPLEKLPRPIRIGISWLTRYTLGIYCTHMMVARLLDYFLTHSSRVPLETDTLGECIVTYLLCYLLCFLISLIPCKWTRMLVE